MSQIQYACFQLNATTRLVVFTSVESREDLPPLISHEGLYYYVGLVTAEAYARLRPDPSEARNRTYSEYASFLEKAAPMIFLSSAVMTRAHNLLKQYKDIPYEIVASIMRYVMSA